MNIGQHSAQVTDNQRRDLSTVLKHIAVYVYLGETSLGARFSVPPNRKQWQKGWSSKSNILIKNSRFILQYLFQYDIKK